MASIVRPLTLAAGLLLWSTSHAQDSADALRFATAVGSSDVGTAFNAQLGRAIKSGYLPGQWRWEAQLATFGGEDVVPFSNTVRRNAWAAGASALPQLPLGRALTAYGKLGVNYLVSEINGPGQTSASVRVGIGGGLRWQATPWFGVRVEYQNFGGAVGDLMTFGAEMPL